MKENDAFRRHNHGADRRGCPDLPVRGGMEVACPPTEGPVAVVAVCTGAQVVVVF